MRTINWSITLFRQTKEGTIEVEDDATEEEIDQLAQEDAMQYLNFGWEEADQ
jgi:hypothetical protein